MRYYRPLYLQCLFLDLLCLFCCDWFSSCHYPFSCFPFVFLPFLPSLSMAFGCRCRSSLSVVFLLVSPVFSLFFHISVVAVLSVVFLSYFLYYTSVVTGFRLPLQILLVCCFLASVASVFSGFLIFLLLLFSLLFFCHIFCTLPLLLLVLCYCCHLSCLLVVPPPLLPLFSLALAAIAGVVVLVTVLSVIFLGYCCQCFCCYYPQRIRVYTFIL